MKRLLFLVASIGFGISLKAQDIIFLKNGDEIQSIVQEIGIEYVKYRKFENQTGPIYNVSLVEIFMIKYENGTKDMFNETAKLQINETQFNTSMDILKSEFYRIGTDDDAMLEFFRRNNFSNYYNRFNSACKSRNTGKYLFNFGFPLMAGGLIVCIVGFEQKKEWVIYTSYGLIGVSEVLRIVSIPISSSAGARKKAIKNNFAKQYFGINSYSYQPTLNFGVKQSGSVGLTVNF